MNQSEMHVLQFNALRDITDVEPIDEKDRACLADIKETLARHNRLARFGVVLLHHHFKLSPDEVLVERCDPSARALRVTPVRRSEVEASSLVETVWRFDGPGGQDCPTYCPPAGPGDHFGYKDHEGS